MDHLGLNDKDWKLYCVTKRDEYVYHHNEIPFLRLIYRASSQVILLVLNNISIHYGDKWTNELIDKVVSRCNYIYENIDVIIPNVSYKCEICENKFTQTPYSHFEEDHQIQSFIKSANKEG